ncbi:MAG: hypothetical protein ACPG5B_16455 [Chitinophagales bacterium]
MNLVKHYFLYFSLLLFAVFYLTENEIKAADVTWQGTISDDWNTAGNWNTGTVPISTDVVFIDFVDILVASYPVVNGVVPTVWRVEMDNETELTIANGGQLTIDATACVNCKGLYMRPKGTLVVEANAVLTIMNTEDYGLQNSKGTVINDGTIDISNTTDRAWYNYTNGSDSNGVSVTNNGTVSFNNTTNIAWYSHIQNDTMNFVNNGSMNFTNIGNHAMYNYSYQENALINFDNNGSITINDAAIRGIYNETRGNEAGWIAYCNFNNNGIINISNTGNDGVFNYNRRGAVFNFNNGADAEININFTGYRGFFTQNSRNSVENRLRSELHNYGTIAIDSTIREGFYCYTNKDSVIMVNHNTIRTKRTGRAGVYNYVNNNYAFLDFRNEGTIDIGRSGFNNSYYNAGLGNILDLTQAGDTTAILHFTNNGSIEIDSSRYNGMYNDADNGDLQFTNNNLISIKGASSKGIYNRLLADLVPDKADLVFENFGTIAIDSTNEQGLFNQAYDDILICNNNGAINITHTNGNAIRNTAVNSGGIVNFTNYQPITINDLTSKGLYTSAENDGLVNFVNESDITINTTTNHGSHIYNVDSEINFTNNGNMWLSNIGNDGLYHDNLGDNEAFPNILNFMNNGHIGINTTTDEGWTNYSAKGISTMINNGTIDIDNVADLGIYNNTNFAGELHFTNENLIEVHTGTDRLLYNLTDNGSKIYFTNNDSIILADTDKAGIYNYTRDGEIHFTNGNMAVIDIDNIGDEAGFYNLCRKEVPEYEADFYFNNFGTINIDNIIDHGFIFNNNNGTMTGNNTGDININTTTEQGFYCYNLAINIDFPLNLNFTNSGNINVENTTLNAFYNYNYRYGMLNFVNDGMMTATQSSQRGVYNFCDNDFATLNFTNNGDIDIDNISQQGFYNYSRQASVDTVNALYCTNNGTIDINHTSLEGWQNFVQRGSMHLINGENASINIKNATDHGLFNYNVEDLPDYHAKLTFDNYGTIQIDSTDYNGLFNNNYRADTLAFNNYGTITIDHSLEDGNYNYNYTSNIAEPFYDYGKSVLNINNFGTMDIDNSTDYGMHNYTDRGEELYFTNYGNLNIATTGIDGIYNRCRPNGDYTPELHFDNMGGTMNISATTSNGIYNYAQNDTLYYHNNGTLILDDIGQNGIYNYAGGVGAYADFYNNATLTLTDIAQHGIYNYSNNDDTYSKFYNDAIGDITISNTMLDGIYNRTSSGSNTVANKLLFVNDGTISVSQTGEKGIHNDAYRTYDFVFNNNGILNISNNSLEALYNSCESDNSNYGTSAFSMQNDGDISINNNQHKGIYNYNYNGTFGFESNGNITIDNVTREGMHNLNIVTSNDSYPNTAFNFHNGGEMKISNAAYEGFKVSNYSAPFEMTTIGKIEIFENGKEGIEIVNYSDSLTVLNTGEIYLHNNAYEALYLNNSSLTEMLFTNGLCGFIETQGRIKNYDNVVFQNDGLLVDLYGQSHINKHRFINNGIIESANGFQLQSNQLENNAEDLPYIAVNDLTFEEGQAISPALTNTDAVYSQINWYSDAAATTSAGNYDAISNTFTPNAALAVGEHTLYVEMNDNVSNCVWLRPINITILPALPYIFEPIIILQGAYNNVTGLMRNDLKINDLLPLAQPFSNYTGTESFATLGDIPNNAVDWILVEARSETDINIIVEQKAAILLNDGSIWNVDGNSGVDFNDLNINETYQFSIKTRHHLAVMSSAVALINTVDNTINLDLSDAANVVDGANQLKDIGNGMYALLAGDFDQNGSINTDDYNLYLNESSAIHQYISSDANLNGQVEIADFNLLLQNNGKTAIATLQD